MHEIMKKTYELIDALDESELISNLEKYRDRILKHSDIFQYIQMGKNTDDEYQLLEIKKKLYGYLDYQNYMKYYNELMYFVMDLNCRYREIVKQKGCFR